MRWLLDWAPAIAWAALIWFFSTEIFDAHSTSRFLLPFLSRLLPGASPAALEQVHFAVRKAGHFAEYSVFALLLFRGIRGSRPEWRAPWAWLTLLLVAGYAALDEFHQSFVATRRASLADILLDVAGGSAAMVFLWWKWRRSASRKGQIA